MPSVSLKGLSKLHNKFDKLEKGLNTQDMLDTLGAFMLHRIRERFLNQEAPSGSRWTESNAAKRRKAQNLGGGTLFDKGTLFHSISVGRTGKSGRSIFTTVDYARKHNEGLDGSIQREFLGFNEEDERLMTNLLDNRVRGLL